MVRVGLDIGSTTVKCVVIDKDNNILFKTYERHYSQITSKISDLLKTVKENIPAGEEAAIAMSGSAGMGVADACGIDFIQEVYATRVAANTLIPNTDVVIELGGEDAKIIYELKPGSTGYVIELGDDWSKVAAYGHEGYCANEFLTMTEITEEEYRELVESHDKAAKSSKGSGKKETAGAVNAAAAADALHAAAQAAQAAGAAESQAGGTAPADGAADAAPAEAE